MKGLRVVLAVLAVVLVAAGCASSSLSSADRVAAAEACLTAGVAAGIPIAAAIADKSSADAVKAQAAADTLIKAGTLGACAKLGQNFVIVLQENQKAKTPAPPPVSK